MFYDTLTANDERFYRKHWEVSDFEQFKLIATGGADAWIAPHINQVVKWGNNGTQIKRFSNTVRTPNEDLYGKEGLAWNYIKDTGRRFGYQPPGRLFSATGYLFVPDEEQSLWPMVSVLNSNLYHSLILSITISRNWTAGYVGSLPWYNFLSEIDELERISKEMYKTKMVERLYNPTSPYYVGPPLVTTILSSDFFYKSPYVNDIDQWIEEDRETIPTNRSIVEMARHAEKQRLERISRLEELSDQADDVIYESFDISEDTREEILNEIFLRTSEEAGDREVPDPSSAPDIPDDLDQHVKDLVHHFAMEAVREAEDGIIPLKGADDQPDMVERIVDRFHGAYGEYAEDRLVEVDDILGTESAGDEAYPNLRAFIEEVVFEYHVETMENTPIFWKLTTEQLLADAKGEGFACFVDYHQLDASLFDRLSNQYLEPRKAELRERRSAANRRQSDESLSTNERAEATEEFEFCSSALEQIAELEEVMQELGSTTERDFDEDDRQLVEELAPKVAAFREETAERIETLAELRERNGEEWFQDTFSDNFWNAVDEWREEWLDALDELEHACEEYAKSSDEPVEAHLADLFDYFNWRLKGSDHYSSTGILFITYYFEREGGDLLNEDGEPFENLTDDERLLASLAMGIDDASIIDEEYFEQIADDEDIDDVADLPPLAEFKALAEEIDDRCQTVDKQIPSDWSARALSEITTAGYQPNQKHGVAINITPLAEKRIVPEVVEDKVI
ncbi:BREX-5 system adenine-specific DNA-methyltransferase PglX [Halobacteria archaeon AArc-curdl1]|uniref:BREX-5 system adenine-specific DNA-methyltransferase PglX n=1 Tax=Natronosalvus hydrolyticus TaxID=2979988 RepID=A0AAP2Z9E4_9EURY|nr:BREX-5 system adenine-specific DNA-methyltransferase PglX [Halobacteria archaeon AArc-curdl1]